MTGHEEAATPDLVRSEGGQGFNLFFDSRNDLPLDGVRAVATSGDVIHLAYSAERADVVLDVTVDSAGRMTVAGQILTCGDASAGDFAVAVHRGEDTLSQARGDDAGRFRLPAVLAPLTRFTADNGPVRIDLAVDLP